MTTRRRRHLPQEVSTRIGVAFQANGHVHAAGLPAAADQALYEATDSGRNTFRTTSA